MAVGWGNCAPGTRLVSAAGAIVGGASDALPAKGSTVGAGVPAINGSGSLRRCAALGMSASGVPSADPVSGATSIDLGSRTTAVTP
ncbi:unannotated protein [freshwater metagenome]|uniref:Unannotated protein n=1 Tax=freshwater metagenome TaxID=449393 RepID=A0A6J7C2J8_9ZZZZ